MAELKTQRTSASVAKFLTAIPDEARRADARTLCKLMEKVSGEKPALWGSAIIGFGERTLTYPNGRELPWMILAFSPRKANLVIYGMGDGDQSALLARLGKHKTSKGCLYLNRVSDIDVKVLEQILSRMFRHAKKA